ncbi:hypothetical protein M407DRAFT_32222 [Tulasnella calospora MUT 4182]|uniref:Uncharacterized protein n=1 Tax=Tulasnella calospora MUT 4182 TaxID=1051891 RepID=A0A0C3L9B7_9AGAM|nr:hypothetical protein M407DRAFT_32222 [Tulasnella calospora MUT 4182]
MTKLPQVEASRPLLEYRPSMGQPRDLDISVPSRNDEATLLSSSIAWKSRDLDLPWILALLLPILVSTLLPDIPTKIARKCPTAPLARHSVAFSPATATKRAERGDLIDFEKLNSYDRYLDLDISALHLLAHLPQACYKKILRLANGPLLALNLREEQSGEAIPVCLSGSERPISRTWPARDLAPLEDGTPTLQHAHAILAWLIHFYLHSAPPRLTTGTVVSTSLSCRLVRVSQWLRTAPVLAYMYPDIQTFELQDDQSFTTNRIMSDLAEEMPDSLGRRSSTQTQSPTPSRPHQSPKYKVPAHYMRLISSLRILPYWVVLRSRKEDLFMQEVIATSGNATFDLLHHRRHYLPRWP